VYVTHTHTATNELEEFMRKYNAMQEEESGPSGGAQDQGVKNHMEALVKGKENELKLNKVVMRGKTGNTLSFGDTIQKFITVRPADLARDERENMKVTLSTDGSVMSWLKVMPALLPVWYSVYAI
ncbi:hypothetical protein B484DRAFT_395369, partial [Ochromonadaceae sp. CCMP2298]